jgi:hypothetical protein
VQQPEHTTEQQEHKLTVYSDIATRQVHTVCACGEGMPEITQAEMLVLWEVIYDSVMRPDLFMKMSKFVEGLVEIINEATKNAPPSYVRPHRN